jgi:hypothetical protein
VIRKHIPEAEIKKIENVMPHNLKSLFCERVPTTGLPTTFATV